MMVAARWKKILAPVGLILAVLSVTVLVSRQSYRASAASRGARSVVTIPAGTKINVRLESAISSEQSSAYDQFQASLDSPLVGGGQVIAPKDSPIFGRLTSVRRDVPLAGLPAHAQLTLVLDGIVIGEALHSLTTQPLTLSDGKAAGRRQPGVAAHSALPGGYIAYGPESRFSFVLAEPLRVPVGYK